MPASSCIILGSRSPRRLELLSSIVNPEQIRVVPPENSSEAGFEDLTAAGVIEDQLRRIVSRKQQDVVRQLEYETTDDIDARILIADTIVVAQRDGVAKQRGVVAQNRGILAQTQSGDPMSQLIVLGQPAEPNWQADVRDWFRNLLSGTSHAVWTHFQLVRFTRKSTSCQHTQLADQTVRSEVTFIELDDSVIEWYISTEESRGKAGGYAIQGKGAALVCGLSGSLTNVIGLPVREVAAAIHR